MKKNFIYVAIVVLAVVGGYFLGRINTPCIVINESESSAFKRELIEVQAKALDAAETIMNNNDIWDIDGSDDMSDYMEYKEKADSLWRTQL